MTNKNAVKLELTCAKYYSLDDIERALERLVEDLYEGNLVSFETARGYGVSFIYKDENHKQRSGCVDAVDLYDYLNEGGDPDIEEIAFSKDTNFYRVVDNYEDENEEEEYEDEAEYDYEDEEEE